MTAVICKSWLDNAIKESAYYMLHTMIGIDNVIWCWEIALHSEWAQTLERAKCVKVTKEDAVKSCKLNNITSEHHDMRINFSDSYRLICRKSVITAPRLKLHCELIERRGLRQAKHGQGGT